MESRCVPPALELIYPGSVRRQPRDTIPPHLRENRERGKVIDSMVDGVSTLSKLSLHLEAQGLMLVNPILISTKKVKEEEMEA